MEFYLPSLLILVFAGIVCVAVFPQFTPVVLASVAIVALVGAAYSHYSLFGREYQFMSKTSQTAVVAPYLLVGAVIMGIVAYLLFLLGSGKKLTMRMPADTIPPPESATNYMTEAIGNGLNASGMANIDKNYNNANNNAANTAQRNALESGLSKGV
jgi:hypothetical protein